MGSTPNTSFSTRARMACISALLSAVLSVSTSFGCSLVDRGAGEGSGGGAGETNGSTSSNGGSGEAGSNGNGGTTKPGSDGGSESTGDGGDGFGGDGPEEDTSAPTVVSISPTGTGAAKDTAVVVTFSEPMDTASAQDITLEFGPAVVELSEGAWSDNDTRVTLQPTSELLYATGVNPNLLAHQYIVTVPTSARDRAGNALTSEVTSTFSTLRKIETLIPVIDQRYYFLGEGEYVSGPSSVFHVRRQIGGLLYEDQEEHALLVFDKADAVFLAALANPDTDTFTLELYATEIAGDATLSIRHINSSNPSSMATTLAATVITDFTISHLPPANTWWSIDMSPLFRHPNFDLPSYNNLQFLLSLDIPGGGPEGTTSRIQFRGGTHVTDKPRLRFSRLVP